MLGRSPSLREPSLGGIKAEADQRREARAGVADLVRRRECCVVRQSTRADARERSGCPSLHVSSRSTHALGRPGPISRRGL